MTTGNDFIPDYSYRTTAGIISAKNSKLLYKEKTAYISVHNRIHSWAIPSMEEKGMIGTGKSAISSFTIIQDNTVVIGYENGLIEIVSDEPSSRTIRLHRRRVNQILPFSTGFISSSVDGSICYYDILLDEPQLKYVGSPVAVERMAIAGGRLLAISADRTLRIWNVSGCDIVDAHAFEEDLFGVASFGKSALVVCHGGKSFLLDLEDRTKRPFETFKKIRNIVQRESRVAIQTQKGIVVFDLVLEPQPRLEAVIRSEISDLFVNFDISGSEILFISKNNAISMGYIKKAGENSSLLLTDPSKTNSITHPSNIIQMEVYNDLVYTLSEERLIIWEKVEENIYEGFENAEVEEDSLKYGLSPIRWLNLSKALCFSVLEDFVVIGRNTGLVIYKDDEIHKEMALGKVISLSSFGNVLAVVVDASVRFYNSNFDVVSELTCYEPVVFSQFTPCGTMFCVSTLDNKIGVYSFPDLLCRTSLYGHSLPVRSFCFTRDGKQLISCGADKLIKIWGLEFGECRKSIVGNAQNVESIVRIGDGGECADNLFLFCDKNVLYYRNFNKLKAFNGFSPGMVKAGSDFFVVSVERGISLFTMNRYEYLEDDASEEVEHPLEGVVADVAQYDEFLLFIEKLEDSWLDVTVKAFYEFLEKTEAAELRTFLQVLDSRDVHLVLSVVSSSLSRNIILNCRIFVLLLEFHKNIVITSSTFDLLRKNLLLGIRDCRDLSGSNEMRMLVEMSKDRSTKE